MRPLPHHDGSDLYLSNRFPRIGEIVELRVRVPKEYRFKDALVRSYHDGEPRFKPLKRLSAGKVEDWWSVRLEITNRILSYRFLFAGNGLYEWLTSAGIFNHEVHSNIDFKLIGENNGPSWLSKTVLYQIFPDRFAKSYEKKLPDWAVTRNWNELPRAKSKFTGIEIFGGDFEGIRRNFDHIEELGANGIYFTPIFPARSNHRYDASNFNSVDPLLGGDTQWFRFAKEAKQRRIRLIGDITTNHVGAGHEWFLKAKNNKKSQERNFFFWDKEFKWGYVGWWDLPSLPKLNFESKLLRNRFYGAKNSVIRKWLNPKYGLSGWRVDVSNMTGRYKHEDHHDEVMTGIRMALDEAHEDAWLVAENADFVASDLDGSGWHGTMNYQGFFRPLAAWMNSSADLSGGFQGLPIDSPKIGASQFVASANSFNSSIPWSALISSMTLLDSHDTPRFRTIVGGDRNKHLSGMVLLLTYPGVPSIFMGDEIGLEGTSGEDSRRTINWDDRSGWDQDFFEQTKHLVRLRKSEDALINGGLRWLASGDDYLAFLRESKRETILVLVSRSAVNVELELSNYGYEFTSDLFVSESFSGEGSSLTVKSSKACQGIWKLKPSVN